MVVVLEASPPRYLFGTTSHNIELIMFLYTLKHIPTGASLTSPGDAIFPVCGKRQAETGESLARFSGIKATNSKRQ